jgi:hypothetical protein
MSVVHPPTLQRIRIFLTPGHERVGGDVNRKERHRRTLIVLIGFTIWLTSEQGRPPSCEARCPHRHFRYPQVAAALTIHPLSGRLGGVSLCRLVDLGLKAKGK